MNANHDYEEMADRAEAGLLKPKGAPVRGGDAAQAGRELLLRATETNDLENAVRLAVGRPPLGANQTPPSKTWRVKAPAELDAALRELAAERGVGLSEIVREATLDYLRAHAS
ncbi:MAG: ribbon-helix-helix protein, CopG family [Actinomycetales bacterium]|nr:ribbon-helix-helix protein, CopG family [Actinomycetales bacterium]